MLEKIHNTESKKKKRLERERKSEWAKLWRRRCFSVVLSAKLWRCELDLFGNRFFLLPVISFSTVNSDVVVKCLISSWNASPGWEGKLKTCRLSLDTVTKGNQNTFRCWAHSWDRQQLYTREANSSQSNQPVESVRKKFSFVFRCVYMRGDEKKCINRNNQSQSRRGRVWKTRVDFSSLLLLPPSFSSSIFKFAANFHFSLLFPIRRCDAVRRYTFNFP